MSMMRRVLGVFLVATAILLAAAPARAQGVAPAWARARAVLPDRPGVLIGVNVSVLKTSATFKQLYPVVLQQAGEAAPTFAQVKTACGIELTDVVQGIVMTLDADGDGVVFIATKGLSQAALTSCFGKLFAAVHSGAKVTASRPDARGIVEYSSSKDKDKLYLAFLGRDVIAVATAPNDKDKLSRALRGKGVNPRSDMARALGKVNTRAAIWGVVNKQSPLDDSGTMKLAYGHADVRGGAIAADVRLVMSSTKEATAAAAKGNQELTQARGSGRIPPQLADLVKSIRIAAVSDEVQIRGSLPERDLLVLLQSVMQAEAGAAAPPAPPAKAAPAKRAPVKRAPARR